MSQIELPEGWCEATLQDVADWGSGGTPSRKYAEYYDGDIPWVKTGDLGPKLLDSCSESITELGLKNSSAKIFPRGSVVLAMYGATIGRTSILGIDATTNQACAVGNPVKGLTSSEFLYYLLSNEKDRFIAKGKGGAQPNISQAVIKEHSFFLPPLAEQQIIADKLDILLAQVESIKTHLKRITEILKQFRQSVLAAAMSGKLMGNAELAWQEVGSFASDIRYGTSKKCDSESGETPVLRIPNIGWGHINLDDLKYADFDQKELNSLKLKKGDLLLIRSNGSVDLVGKVAIVSENEEYCIFAGYLIRLRLDADIVHPKYVVYCLQSPQLRQVIELIARSTSGVNNINSKELLGLKIPVPSLDVQQEIIKKIEQLQGFSIAIEQQVQSALDRVNNLTQSILAKAFRGELTAEWREANSELISGQNSTEALLERIKVERRSAIKRGRGKA